MLIRICAAILLACSLIVSPAYAQTTPGTDVRGQILETSAGLPVVGAKIDLRRGESVVASTTTAADGGFVFHGVAPGSYSVFVSANGYQSSLIKGLIVEAGQAVVETRTALSPQKGELKEIYTATVYSTTALNTSSTINSTLSPSLITDQNYIRAGDALGNLPFVTRNTSSSLGDDEVLSLRGFDPTEGAALLDGHPLGPIGAYGTAYDYQLGQFWGFSNINVIYGSGATGLYSVPVLSGAVDFQTLNPTPTNHFKFTQGYGDLDHAMTAFSYTGTTGKLGFALAYGVQGTSGEIDQPVFQSGDLAGGNLKNCTGDPTNAAYIAANNADPTMGNGGVAPPSLLPQDLSACNYQVDGDYVNRNAIGKLQYQLDNKTAITATVYNATMYADSQGNGDTDFVPYAFQLAAANSIVSTGTNNFQLLNGQMTNCSSSTIAALSQASSGYSCLTPQQYASDFQGPQGGGTGRFHSGLSQDYHLRVTRSIGAGNLTLDGFIDNYDFINVKGPPPSKAEQDTFFTHGGVISDEFAGKTNDVSFGVDWLHQLHETNQQSSPIFGPPTVGYFITQTSYFIHDTYSPTSQLSIFANLSLERSYDTATTNFDPRLAFVFRPTNNDVFRIAGGRATSEPDPSLLSGGFQFSPSFANNQSFNPQQNCQPLVALGSGDSPYVKPEQANDLEAAYAHRFKNNITIEADAYDSIETNPILSAVYPLSIVPAGQLPPPSYFQAYAQALQGACLSGLTYSEASFGVSAPYNAGSAIYRGYNLSTKIPITRELTLTGGYSVQSAFYSGLNDDVLMNNTGLVNNQQFYEIPLQQANAGIEYNSKPGHWLAAMDAYYTGNNNGLNRGAYWTVNANASKTVDQITFNLGIQNLFNSAASQYGLIGYGQPQPQNQFGSPGQTPFEQGSEEYNLPYRQVWMTMTFSM
jgi:hypothetical protein